MMKVRKLLVPSRGYSTKRNKEFLKKKCKNAKNTNFVNNNANSNPGINNRLNMYRENEMAAEISASHEFEELHKDVDEFESDFINAGKLHRIHEKELEVQKEKLKTKIIFSKYLKELEPSFLTFSEKEQIKSLHKGDPYEWSVEKLSESFPALPATIKKVLHAKWTPKSVEAIVRYDEKVISNWKAFRAAELPLNSLMEKHLQNFKDRHIVQTNREGLAERFIPHRTEFPKPKSMIFLTIANTLLLSTQKKRIITDDKNADVEFSKNSEVKSRHFEANENFGKKNSHFERNRNSYKENFLFESNINWGKQNRDFETSRNLKYNNGIFDKNRNFEENGITMEVRSLTIDSTEVESHRRGSQMTPLSQNLDENDIRENNKPLTFDEFLLKNVDRTKDSSAPEDIVLRETYKKHMEKIAFESKPASFSPKKSKDTEDNFKSKPESEAPTVGKRLHPIFSEEIEKGSESRISTRKTGTNEIYDFSKESRAVAISKRGNSEMSMSVDISSLDTYVKEWIKKDDDTDDPPFIKIPKQRYKEGMTYRVQNCYYDDDGEFLYKIPGFHK